MKLNKKTFLTSASVLTSSLVCSAQPNIVFILADDMGYGDVSALNKNSLIKTPAIDNLSCEGITFTDAHSSSSVSTPTRYGLLTGRYSFRTTVKSGALNGFAPPIIAPDRRTMATYLSEKGYTTACIGKWHLGWNWGYRNGEVDYSLPIEEGPVTRGFNYFFGIVASLDMPPYVYVENNRVTALPNRISSEGKGIHLQRSGPQGADFEHTECLQKITSKSLEYISQQSADQPFFLYMPLTAPHTPILPSTEFQGKSGLSPYGDFVMMVDNVVAQVVDKLKKQGLYDNTIIVFAADNGCFHGAGVKPMEEQGHFPSSIYRGYKSDLFDGGHHIPLIISWGGRNKGLAYNEHVCLTDFYATFAEMTGYEMDSNEGEDSYSLWNIITNKGKSQRKDIIHHSNNGNLSLREGCWKILFAPDSGGWSFPTHPRDNKYIDSLPSIQLYNMDTDPGETQNVVDQHPEIVRHLMDQMKDYIKRGRSTPGKDQTNETNKEWKQIEPFMKDIETDR